MIMSRVNQDGFTLVEVFVAMMIFLLGILPLFRLEIAAIEGNSYAQQLTKATGLGEARMEELLAMSYTSLVAASPTLQTVDGYAVNWSKIEDIANTQTITVTVDWTYKSKTHTINFKSIKAK